VDEARAPPAREAPLMRTAWSALLVATLALAFGACGDSNDNAAKQSPEEKAQASVCAARDDISKQVDELKSLTASTVTIDGVKQNLTSIKNDLQDISSAQKTLSSDRRSEVEAANKAFATSVESIASSTLTSLSLSEAKSSLVDALQQLATSYEETFGKLSCS
jgi:hypothetical protein